MTQKLERTNPYNGEFSPTGIETAFCLRKFYFSKMLGLKSNITPYALWYGAAVHLGVETFYKDKNIMSHVEVRNKVIEVASADWISHNVHGDNKRNLASLIITMGNYCDEYEHDQADIMPAFVEASQWVPMPNGTMLLCKIDRVREDCGRKTIVDTKTSSWALTDFFFKRYENNLQTSLYYHAVETLIGECHGVQIDGIKVPPPPEGSSTIPFARRTFLREELQLEDAINTYCRVTDYIMEGMEKYKDDEEGLLHHMYCNQTKCDEYGGCEFLPICKYGFGHPAVVTEFTREEVKHA